MEKGEKGGRRGRREGGRRKGGGREKEGRREGEGGGRYVDSFSNASYVVSCVGKLTERQKKKDLKTKLKYMGGGHL